MLIIVSQAKPQYVLSVSVYFLVLKTLLFILHWFSANRQERGRVYHDWEICQKYPRVNSQTLRFGSWRGICGVCGDDSGFVDITSIAMVIILWQSVLCLTDLQDRSWGRKETLQTIQTTSKSQTSLAWFPYNQLCRDIVAGLKNCASWGPSRKSTIKPRQLIVEYYLHRTTTFEISSSCSSVTNHNSLVWNSTYTGPPRLKYLSHVVQTQTTTAY